MKIPSFEDTVRRHPGGVSWKEQPEGLGKNNPWSQNKRKIGTRLVQKERKILLV